MTAVIPENPALATGSLAGRVLLITGAGDGLGRATALLAARAGATTVLLGRTIKKLEATYDAIEALGGPQPAIFPMNLNGASWNDHLSLAETIEAQLGQLHGIAHCAAHFTGFARLIDLAPKDWLDGVQTNLTAAYVLTRSCMPLLEKSDDASVVFVSDSGGRQPKAYQGIYGVAKAALEALSKTWALECASALPQLRFNTFNPGPMRTAVRVRGYAGEGGNETPSPDAAAARLLWLLGPASRGISGQAL